MQVTENPPRSNIFNDAVPWETDQDRQIKDWQDNAEHNVAVDGRYDDQRLSNGYQLPRDFPGLSDSGGNVSVSQPVPSPREGGRPSPGSGEPIPGGGPHSGHEPGPMGRPGS